MLQRYLGAGTTGTEYAHFSQGILWAAQQLSPENAAH